MSTPDDKPFIIIKRVKKIKKGGHHGGSWKIAYADFVTAMMAFFLLMWLLALLNKYQLQGVAEYFQKPLKSAFQHQGNQNIQEKGTDKEKEKNKEKNKEKEKEKEKEKNKEKPEKIDPHQQQLKQMTQLKTDLENKLNTRPELKEFKNLLNFTVTADGLKVELRDLANKPMFSSGKADFEQYAKDAVKWLSSELNNYPNRLVIIGHTDAQPYAGTNYTNWELSADRANATREALVKSGMNPDKIIRIIGEGDRDLLDPANPKAPINRRIELIILTTDAEENRSGF